MKKIIRYAVSDILRNRIIIAYTFFLLLFSLGLFVMEDSPEKSLISLLTLNLILIPLISIVFSTIYMYNSSEFIELLSAQPVRRKSLWLSFFIGLSSSLILAFLIGCGIPVLIFAPTAVGVTMLITGVFLTFIFTGLAMFVVVFIQEKTKGIGISLLVWLYFALLFDGLVLFLLFQLMDYPIENLIIGLSMLNPVDTVRISVLLKMDISAIMGATGAVFKQRFSGISGTLITFSVLILWSIIPLFFSVRKFDKKDL